MVAAVYLKNGLSGEPGKRGAAGKAYAVGGAVIGRQHFVRCSRKLGWEVLPQSAPEKDIHKLKAAAYAKERLILRHGKLKQQTVLSVTQGAGFRAGARLLPVEKRRDILSAGEQYCITHGKKAVYKPFIACQGQNDGQTSAGGYAVCIAGEHLEAGELFIPKRGDSYNGKHIKNLLSDKINGI